MSPSTEIADTFVTVCRQYLPIIAPLQHEQSASLQRRSQQLAEDVEEKTDGNGKVIRSCVQQK
eukprot:SAG31_NODE_30445_length_381_cov_0.734043_1_plen_62_part_10